MSDYRPVDEVYEGMEIARKDGTWVAVTRMDRTGPHTIIDLADGKFVIAGRDQTIRCRYVGEVTPLVQAARSL